MDSRGRELLAYIDARFIEESSKPIFGDIEFDKMLRKKPYDKSKISKEIKELFKIK